MNFFGKSALHIAIENRNDAFVNFPIGKGADVNNQTENGRSPLMIASKTNLINPFLTLLNAGASIDTADYRGETVLHYAVKHSSIECLDLLVVRHADVNKQDQRGRTPLMIAIKKGLIDAFSRLLSAGAKVDLQDSWGCTALHHAMAESQVIIIQLLLSQTADAAKRSSLTYTIRAPTRRSRMLMLEKDSFLTVADDRGLKLLLFDVGQLRNWGSWRILDFLEAIDSNSECRFYKDGMNALDFAVLRNDEVCARILEPLIGPRTEYTTMPFPDLVCEVFDDSSIRDAEEKRERFKEMNERYNKEFKSARSKKGRSAASRKWRSAE
ncbi:MAG: hypothetical protein Q9170_005886 [Blastenia crenularia]